MGHSVIGIDVGGTNVVVVATTGEGERLGGIERPALTGRGGGAVLNQITEMVRRLEAEIDQEVLSVGIGAAGIIEARTGLVKTASSTFSDWIGRPLATVLTRELGKPVQAINDVKAFLMGELRWGSLRGHRDALALMLGTGVGGAVALDGDVLAGGADGAGEIGHTPWFSKHACTCGGTGHLETLASGRSVELRYAERSGVCLPAPAVAALARQGDPAAVVVFDEAGTAISRAVVAAATLLDLDQVVIGGGLSNAWDLLYPRISAGIEENPPVSGRGLRVVRSFFKNSAMGAAALALRVMDAEGDRSS